MSNAKSRNAAIAMFIAALAILIGVFTHSWFTADRGDGGIGLTGIEECRRGMCRSATWGEMGDGIPSELPLFGYVGFLGGLLAAAGCAAAGVMLLRGNARKLPIKLVSGAFAVAALGQLAFVNRIFAAGEMKGVSLGWSLFVALGGLIAAAVITKTMVMPAIEAESGVVKPPVPASQPYTIA
jgi:hypothetical protein